MAIVSWTEDSLNYLEDHEMRRIQRLLRTLDTRSLEHLSIPTPKELFFLSLQALRSFGLESRWPRTHTLNLQLDQLTRLAFELHDIGAHYALVPYGIAHRQTLPKRTCLLCPSFQDSKVSD